MYIDEIISLSDYYQEKIRKSMEKIEREKRERDDEKEVAGWRSVVSRFGNSAVCSTSVFNLKNMRGYEDAKKRGDYLSASRITDEIVSGAQWKFRRLGEVENAVILPVLGMEGEKANNQLPLAFASNLSALIGAGIDTSICQCNKVRHTGADWEERMLAVSEWKGEVDKEKNYIIVDDALTSGATINSLRHYIEENGGRVCAVATLASGRYGAFLGATQSQVANLRYLDSLESGGHLEGYVRAMKYKGGFTALSYGEARMLVESKILRENVVKTYRSKYGVSAPKPTEIQNKPTERSVIDNIYMRIDAKAKGFAGNMRDFVSAEVVSPNWSSTDAVSLLRPRPQISLSEIYAVRLTLSKDAVSDKEKCIHYTNIAYALGGRVNTDKESKRVTDFVFPRNAGLNPLACARIMSGMERGEVYELLMSPTGERISSALDDLNPLFADAKSCAKAVEQKVRDMEERLGNYDFGRISRYLSDTKSLRSSSEKSCYVDVEKEVSISEFSSGEYLRSAPFSELKDSVSALGGRFVYKEGTQRVSALFEEGHCQFTPKLCAQFLLGMSIERVKRIYASRELGLDKDFSLGADKEVTGKVASAKDASAEKKAGENKNKLRNKLKEKESDMDGNSMYKENANATINANANDADNSARELVKRELVSSYVKSLSPHIKVTLSSSPNTNPELLRIFFQNKSTSQVMRNLLVENTSLPPELIEMSAKSSIAEMRLGAFKNASAPLSLLEANVGSKDVDVRIAIANNKSATEQILRTLSRDRSYRVKAAVAGNAMCPSDILRSFAKDKNEEVRVAVANNRNTPSDVLTDMRGDESLKVREGVAQNRNTPQDVIMEFLNADRLYHRYIAQNESCPANLQRYFTDANITETCMNPKCTRNVFDVFALRCPHIVIENQNCPDDIICGLAHHKSSLMRADVAASPKASASVLDALSRDANVNVRESVAMNRNTSPEILQRLLKDENNGVRACANLALIFEHNMLEKGLQLGLENAEKNKPEISGAEVNNVRENAVSETNAEKVEAKSAVSISSIDVDAGSGARNVGKVFQHEVGLDNGKALSVNDAVAKVVSLVMENERLMDSAFSKCRASRADLSYKSIENMEEKEIDKTYKVVVPWFINKEVRGVLKDYAEKLGGKYTNFRFEDKAAGQYKTYAEITFDKSATLAPEICAKIVVGEDLKNIVESIEDKAKRQEDIRISALNASIELDRAFPDMSREENARKSVPDAIILYEAGTAMQCFGDDAKKLSELTGAKMQSITNPADGSQHALLQFPKRGLEAVLKNILQSGYEVSILPKVAMQKSSVQNSAVQNMSIEKTTKENAVKTKRHLGL